MKEVLNLTLEEFISNILQQDFFDAKCRVLKIDGAFRQHDKKDFSPIRLDAHSIVVVLKGEAKINLDYQSYILQKNNTLIIIIEDIVENIVLSEDFKGYHIIISRDLFMEVMFTLKSLFSKDIMRIRRSHRLNELDEDEMQIILDIIKKSESCINNTTHIYRIQIIKNKIADLILEMDNIMWKKYGKILSLHESDENVNYRFIQLLLQYCKKEHEVAFYANQLNITSDHLSKIMRNLSGKSAIGWINHAIITEAKILLRKPDMNIQQVSSELNFYDQSTFGRFFKRNTGKSPLQYKKETIKF